MKKLIAASVLLFASTGVFAGGLDLALSDETANLAFLFNPPGVEVSHAQVGIGVLYNDADDLLFHASVLALGPGRYDGRFFRLGAGVKIYAGDLDGLDETIGALAIGGRLGIPIVRDNANPVDAVVEGYFAPGITSAGDTESLMEWAARIQVEIVPSARAYLGYRFVEADVEDIGDVEIDDNFHVGISIDFY